MTRCLLSAVLLAFFLVGSHPTGAGPVTLETLRVLTYNIHHGEGTDGQFDLPRIGDIITSVSPDLVALQEVDEGTDRAGGTHQLTELGRLTGLHAAFGKAMDFQGGAYGVGILSRAPILGTDNLPLPGTPDREPRTALSARVAFGGRGDLLRFTSTHLDQGRDAGNRLAQAGFINAWLAASDNGAAILAGDMNSRIDTDVMQVFGERWTDVFLDPAPVDQTGRPRFRVDHVLARPAATWRTVESRIVDDLVASDHRPVLVVLERLGFP